MYMFCRDSKLLGMEKMGRQFCIGPYGKCAERLLLRSAATDYTIFTPYIIFRQVNAWANFSAEDCLSAKFIKGHSILYRQPNRRLMCKSDLHESAWNCAELTDISDIFIGKKSLKFSFFRCWVIRGQVAEIRDFATSNGYSSNTKTRESQVHMANWLFVPSVSFGTIFS